MASRRRYPLEPKSPGRRPIKNMAAVLLASMVGIPAPLTGETGDELVLTFPQDASATWFIDTYGAGKTDGRRHQGEDLHAPKGTPVLAAADGVVLRLGHGPRAGYYLVIQHANDWRTWYMHLNNDLPGTDNGRGGAETAYARGLEAGDFVTTGQVIGYVGDSGNAEGTLSHTHFELHRGRRVVNPYSYLLAAYDRALEIVLQAKVAEVAAA